MVPTNDAPVALIVGGLGGIGAAISARFAGLGARVVVASRTAGDNPDALKRLREQSPGAAIEGLSLDVRDPDACMAAVTGLNERYGRLDSVVNCSNTETPGAGGRFSSADPAAFSPMIEASVHAQAYLCRATHGLMAKTGGAVVLFASDAARFAAPNQVMVGATRSAIVGFVRNYAIEAASDGIRAHCICCTYVRDTPIFERLRDQGSRRIETASTKAGLGLPTPADIAPLVAFLCSAEASRITGQIISVNGGLSA